jgi:hypothetical protein
MQETPRVKISLEDIAHKYREKVSSLKCQICKNILDKAYSDACGHIFCRDCGLPVYQSKKKCPVTDQPLKQEPVAVQYLDAVINETYVYCLNWSNLCKWQGMKSELDDHLANDCTKELVVCGYDECGEMMAREFLKSHMSSCDYRKINCPYCKESVTLINQSGHNAACNGYPVTCVNLCGQLIPRKLTKEHTDNHCPKTVISCPFAFSGCEEKMDRCLFQRHLETNLASHILILLNAVDDKKCTYLEVLSLITQQIDEISHIKMEQLKLKNELNELKVNNQSLRDDLTSQVNSQVEKLLGQKRPREEAIELEPAKHFFVNPKDEEKFTINEKKIKYIADDIFSYVFHNYRKKSSYTEWSITLNTNTLWMAFGLANKDKIMKDRPVNIKHGYFLSSNGNIFNCTDEEEDDIALPGFKELRKGDTVHFRNEFKERCLLFKTSKGNYGKISTPLNASLIPCVLFYFKNDEVMLEY